jgi:hypothetical protein
VIQALAVTITVVLVRFLLAGSAMDISHSSWVLAPGVLSLAVGWGLLSRGKLPYLADALAIALLLPMRGWLCDVSLAVLPAEWGGDLLAAVLSLGPLGFVLGRQLSSLLQAGVLWPLVGWIAGEALVQLGIVAWCPGPLTGFVVAALLAALVEMGTGRRTSYAGGSDDRVCWGAVLLGVVLALLLVVLRRVAPAYASPSADVNSEALLGLLLPAALVTGFAVLLTEASRARRVAYTLGLLGLAWACLRSVESLGLYTNNAYMIQLTREFRTTGNQGWPLVSEWHLWLFLFSAIPGAALGVAFSSLRRSAAGPLALGLGVGLLSEIWVGHDPVFGPLSLLMLAGGLSLGCCLTVWHRRWLLLLPLVLLPFLLLPSSLRVGFDGVRRVGDYAVDGWRRSVVADLSLFSTGTLDNLSVEGRREARSSFTNRIPFLSLGSQGELLFKGESLEPAEELPLPFRPGFDPEDDAPVERYFGVRVAGTDMHANHDPVGPQGSLGRLNRLFAVRGRALALGVGAELLAADLIDAGLARGRDEESGRSSEVTVTSRVPMGPIIRRVLLDKVGLDSSELDAVLDDELRTLRGSPVGSFETVVLAPERGLWPGSGALLSRSVLSRLRERLAPGGRLLAWVDTSDLDTRALSARLAAFGAVFGTSSMALLELRELDAPFVLMVGWRDDGARPSDAEFRLRCGPPDRTGFRSRLESLSDLAAMLLFDGEGLADLAQGSPIHDRDRPVPAGAFSGHGAVAVAGVYVPGATLAQVTQGDSASGFDQTATLKGMALHSRYFFQLDRLRGAMMVEPLADVEWPAFEREVAAYTVAATEAPGNPLLHLAVAALLEPLAREDNLSRFAQAFLEIDCEPMDSWRLGLLHAYVAVAALEPELAEAADARARKHASWLTDS